MTLKLSTRQWADTQYAFKIQEPIIEIDYIKAVEIAEPRSKYLKKTCMCLSTTDLGVVAEKSLCTKIYSPN